MRILTQSVIRRLRERPEWGLVSALESAHVFRLATGRYLVEALQQVLPVDEWYNTKGEDAVAALELADP